MLIFDIGANVGRYSLANIGRARKIVAVEASPRTYTRLCNTVRSYSNIEPLNYAVCNMTGETVTFYDCTADTLSTLDKDWLSSASSRFGTMPKSFQEVTVPAISIDKLIERYGVPDLLKVDVEGAENIVLRSLTQKVPLLCFEWAAEWRDKNKQCIHHLASLGFTRFYVQMEDKYDYSPPSFDKSVDEILTFLDVAKDKVDWGMIWTTVS